VNINRRSCFGMRTSRRERMKGEDEGAFMKTD
jgi:hypothetical protein